MVEEVTPLNYTDADQKRGREKDGFCAVFHSLVNEQAAGRAILTFSTPEFPMGA